jgi:hypothetical protein
MILDNKKATYNIWLVKFISTVIFFPLVSVISFSYFFTGPVLGLERTHYILIACALYIGIMVYYTLKHPYFIFYSDRSEKNCFEVLPNKGFKSEKTIH